MYSRCAAKTKSVRICNIYICRAKTQMNNSNNKGKLAATILYARFPTARNLCCKKRGKTHYFRMFASFSLDCEKFLKIYIKYICARIS